MRRVHICTFRRGMASRSYAALGQKYTAQIAEAVVALLMQERLRQGVSHETLAGLAGVHRSTISRTEAGLMNPTFLVLHAIAVALGLRFSDVLADAEARVPFPRRSRP